MTLCNKKHGHIVVQRDMLCFVLKTVYLKHINAKQVEQLFSWVPVQEITFLVRLLFLRSRNGREKSVKCIQ